MGVKEKIDKWVDEGVIASSRSEYASPLVIVKKEQWGYEIICKLIKDSYPIPTYLYY